LGPGVMGGWYPLGRCLGFEWHKGYAPGRHILPFGPLDEL
jgi:hypothetical protein